MKSKQQLTAYASAALLSFLIGGGAILCIATAFPLGCNIFLLTVLCLGICLLAPGLFLLPRRKLLLSLFWLSALLLGYLLRAPLWEGLRYAAFTITSMYARAYPVFSPLSLGTGRIEAADPTLFLAVLGLFAALLVSWTVLRRQTAFPVYTLFLLTLVIFLINLDTVPGFFAIFLLLEGMLLLTLTHGARKAGEGCHKLTLCLFLPTILFLGFLSLLFPRSTYVRSEWSDTLQERTTNALARLPMVDLENGRLVFTPPDLGGPMDHTAVNLQWVGPQSGNDRQVMSVKTTLGGPLYLRGVSLGSYTGSSWEPVPGSAYKKEDLDHWAAPPIWESVLQNTVSVRTDVLSNVIYTPYFSAPFAPMGGQEPAIGAVYYDAYLRNTDSLSRYTITAAPNGWSPVTPQAEYLALLDLLSTYISTPYAEINDWSGGAFSDTAAKLRFHEGSMLDWTVKNEAYTDFVEETYTQLPDSTRQALLEIIRREGLDQSSEAMGEIPDRAALAFNVANYVRGSADYDLKTPKMPLGKDFVLWFLEESDTGYCVHFASATVALLRAMDIPARYVTGYTVVTASGQWTPVTENEAHAWAEFYLPGLGWVPLESTPAGDSQSVTPPPVTTEPTDEQTEPSTSPATEPSETGPSAESEIPSVPTAPLATDLPVTKPPTEPTIPERPGPTLPGPPGTDTPPAPEPQRSFPWQLLWALFPPLLLVFHRGTVLLFRRRALRGSNLNRRAIRQYLHLEKLAKLVGVPVPEELTDLAKKAKFSRDGVTRPELTALAQFRESLLPQLRARPWYKRFWDRWLRVLY